MVKAAWDRIKYWGERNAPLMLEDLSPGAPEAAVSVLESTLQCQLPEDFRASLMIHNGENDGWPCKVFADCGAYLSIDRIIEEWKQRLEIATELGAYSSAEEQARQIQDGVIEVSGSVEPVLFHKEWIPIMDNNGDVFWALDFRPASGGVSGQLIAVDWEARSWKVVAPSFGEFMEHYASDLEAGNYQIISGLPTQEEKRLSYCVSIPR